MRAGERQADLATERERQLTTARANQTLDKKMDLLKIAQRKYDSNLCKLGNKSEQRWYPAFTNLHHICAEQI